MVLHRSTRTAHGDIVRRKSRVSQKSNSPQLGRSREQQFKQLFVGFSVDIAKSGDHATRPRETYHKPRRQWIAVRQNNGGLWSRLGGGGHGRHRRGDDKRGLLRRKLLGQRLQSLDPPVRPPLLQPKVGSLLPPQRCKPFLERGKVVPLHSREAVFGQPIRIGCFDCARMRPSRRALATLLQQEEARRRSGAVRSKRAQ